MSFENPDAAAMLALFKGMRNIVVLGLSPQPRRPSHVVAKAMQAFGFRIIPVRPLLTEVLGERAYGALSEVPERIDVVTVFRAAEYLDDIVTQCIALRIPALWIQEGIVNIAAAQRARAAGIFVVMDRCLYKDYVALVA